MKRYFILLTGLFCLYMNAGTAFAGNPERSGQAGATQLLINPYARSSGLFGMNVATVAGVEGMLNNPAGLAFGRSTEVVIANTQWLMGSGISVNCLGVSQALGPNGGTIGVTAMAFGFGQIPITTIDNPDGGLGTYSPTFLNMGISYGRMMVEDRIYVGFTVKMVHESVPDVSANGVAFDAGVQYRTGDGKFRLGVALRNIGPTMKFSGDGLTTRLPIYNNGASSDRAMSSKAATFEMPSALYVGAAYEIRAGRQSQRYKMKKQTIRGDTSYLKLDSLTVWDHKIIPMFTFISNTFTRDQLGLGLEYRYMEMLMLRASYLYEAKILNTAERRNVYSGIAVGASFEFPFSMKNPKVGERNKLLTTIAVDYSYRHTFFFNGTHSFGIRFSL